MQMQLRMGDETAEKRDELITGLLQEFGILKIKDSLVGVPGTILSGGERRRLSLCMQLLSYKNASIFLLDEPVTGLDLASASNVICRLQDMADLGFTVILTIHQLTSQLAARLDRITMMKAGNCLFYGSQPDLVTFLTKANIKIPKYFPPVEVALEVALEEKHKKHEALMSASRDLISSIDASEFSEDDKETLERFPISFLPLKPPRTFFDQLKILVVRSFHQGKVIWLNKTSLAVNFCLGLFMGLAWFQIPHEFQNFYDHSSATYVIIAFAGVQYIYNIAMIQFPQEAEIILEENRSGVIRISSYFISRAISDFIFLSVMPIIFLTTAFLFTGLRLDGVTWILYLCLSFCAAWSSAGLGTLASHLFSTSFSDAAVFGTVLIHFLTIFSFYANQLPSWLSWAKYCSYLWYILHGSYHIIYDGQTDWVVLDGKPSRFGMGPLSLNSTQLLDTLYVDDMGLWVYYMVTLGWGAAFYLLAFAVLWCDFRYFRN
eukprot:TRINITY_DN5875_c0_g1_i2.p1 TRINITY_DN5875_c0_g1~~TRINITY_DN5875_c0_g1_i2.p1  ORF type:complete len:490 (-),score=51.25 TRINITY_DN5875_c0_g1_i2:29-1498(-)